MNSTVCRAEQKTYIIIVVKIKIGSTKSWAESKINIIIVLRTEK